MEDLLTAKIVTYNQLAKELDELYQLYAKKSGLSETAFWILYCIHERKEPYTQKELCEIWSYSRQTVNSALKNLEAEGTICLEPVAGNRKNKLLVLTPAGEALVAAVVAPLVQAEKAAFAQLGERETDEFLQLTRRHIELLRAEVSKIPGQGGKRPVGRQKDGRIPGTVEN